jgi:hypothetical protein
MFLRTNITANYNDYHYISLAVIDSEFPALLSKRSRHFRQRLVIKS